MFTTIPNNEHVPNEINVQLKKPNVFGTLLDSKGEPIANVDLELGYYMQKKDISGGWDVPIKTDGHGHFEKHLSAGSYFISGYQHNRGSRLITVPFVHQFTVSESEEVLSSMITQT
ncbi:hypothetical protein ACFCP7_28095, partial [Paenibacillus elgii]